MGIMLSWQQINLFDCAARWATKLFLTESCAEMIASGTSCFHNESADGFKQKLVHLHLKQYLRTSIEIISLNDEWIIIYGCAYKIVIFRCHP